MSRPFPSLVEVGVSLQESAEVAAVLDSDAENSETQSVALVNPFDVKSNYDDSSDSLYNNRSVQEDNGDSDADTVETTLSFVNTAGHDEPIKETDIKKLAKCVVNEISSFTDAMRDFNITPANTVGQVYRVTLCGKSTINAAIDLSRASEPVKTLRERDSRDFQQAIELAKQILRVHSPASSSSNNHGDTMEFKKLEENSPDNIHLLQELGLRNDFKLPEDLTLYHQREDMEQAMTTFRAEMYATPPPPNLAYLVRYIDHNALDMVSLAIRFYYEAVNALQECEQDRKDARRLMGLAKACMDRFERG